MLGTRKPVIYQLVVRYFSNVKGRNTQDGTIEENGCGKFEEITAAALIALKEMGVTHLWLTGILRHATLTTYPELPADELGIVKGRAGSPYAVKDYFDVSPDYATEPSRRMEEFAALVRRIHDAGLYVLIDFVPNHVARSYQSLVQPEWSFGNDDDQSVFFARDNSFFYLPGRALVLPQPKWRRLRRIDSISEGTVRAMPA